MRALNNPIGYFGLEFRVRSDLLPRDLCSDAIKSILQEDLCSELGLIVIDIILFEATAYLQDQTSQSLEGFDNFLLQNPKYLKAKYPLVLTTVKLRARAKINFYKQLLQRLCVDWVEIKEYFSLTGNEIVSLKLSAGDSHHNGKSVCIFITDQDERFVFKPRSVETEEALQSWIHFVEESFGSIGQKTINVLRKSGYGWVEYVGSSRTKNAIELERYYHRYGRLLAAIDLANATDIHFENLIACGEYPVVVDAETAIQPVEYLEPGSQRFSMNHDFYCSSVLFTAMIAPPRMHDASDKSPLAGPVTVRKRRPIIELDANHIPLIALQAEVACNHVPFDATVSVDQSLCAEFIAKGYRQVKTHFLCNRARYLDKVVALFGTCEVRVILRYTSTYSSLIDALCSPYCMESEKNRDEYITKLMNFADRQPGLKQAVQEEVRQVLALDIPYFQSHVGENAISSDKIKIEAVFKESGIARTKSRMVSYTTADLDNEVNCIKYVINCKQLGSQLESSCFHNIFLKIRVLSEQASAHGELVDLGSDILRDIKHRSLLGDLYSGNSGLSFAIAYYAKNFDIGFEPLARSLLQKSFNAVDRSRLNFPGICEGLGGLIYTAAHYERLFPNSGFVSQAIKLSEEAVECIGYDRYYDLYRGSSGLIMALISLNEAHKDSSIKSWIQQAANVIDAARPRGSLWQSSIPGKKISSGFAHGVSGIGFALLQARSLLETTDYDDSIIAVAKYLEACNRSGSWLESPDSEGTMQVWCHGAFGILSFNRALYRAIKSENFQFQSVNDLSRMPTAPWEYENDSLCHGTLGNIDLIFDEIDQDALNIYITGLKSRPPKCGTLYNHHCLGLFTGMSGIAYQQMRIQNRDKFPSVLCLERPT